MDTLSFFLITKNTQVRRAIFQGVTVAAKETYFDMKANIDEVRESIMKEGKEIFLFYLLFHNNLILLKYFFHVLTFIEK